MIGRLALTTLVLASPTLYLGCGSAESSGDTGGTTGTCLVGDDGRFPARVDYPAGSGAVDVAALDLNGDGHLDLAVANLGDGNVTLLQNAGDGTFTSAGAYATAKSPMALAATDLDGDGRPNVRVVAHGDRMVAARRVPGRRPVRVAS